LSKGLFEINFVEHENPFYQLGKLYTYSLTCELTTIDNDEFTTGETDVDVVVTETKEAVYQFALSTEVSTDLSFYDGETIFQVRGATGGTYSNATAEAICFKYNVSDNTMNVYGISGSFLYSSQTIRGKDSGAEYYVSGITGTDIFIPITPITSTADGDNEHIKQTGNVLEIYDFTDIDPFSEGIY
jgi:hypothetical protein